MRSGESVVLFSPMQIMNHVHSEADQHRHCGNGQRTASQPKPEAHVQPGLARGSFFDRNVRVRSPGFRREGWSEISKTKATLCARLRAANRRVGLETGGPTFLGGVILGNAIWRSFQNELPVRNGQGYRLTV